MLMFSTFLPLFTAARQHVLLFVWFQSSVVVVSVLSLGVSRERILCSGLRRLDFGAEFGI